MGNAAIDVEGLVKTFGTVRAVDGIDMVAREGTVFGLLGPNGAGKTTTIRVLSTLLKPDAGRATVRVGAGVAGHHINPGRSPAVGRNRCRGWTATGCTYATRSRRNESVQGHH